MLHLLQQKKRNTLQLILLLLGISFGMHVIVLTPIFVSRIGAEVYKMRIGLDCADLANVVISHISEPARVPSVASTQKESGGMQNVQKTVPVQKKMTTVQQPKAIPKPTPKKAIPPKPKSKPPAKQVTKPAPKKVVPVAPKTAPMQKKQPVQKEGAQQKTTQKKEAVPQKKNEPVVQKQQAKPAQSALAGSKADVKKETINAAQSTASSIPAQRVVAPQEYAALELQACVQEAVQEQWYPPAGLAKDLSCDVSIAIDTKGKATHCTLTESSGVLMYDVHVQSTLLAVQYPRVVWGKTVELNFTCS